MTDIEGLLARYSAGPDQLEVVLEGLGDEGLDVALEPGSWTIRQIVHHVADGDDLWNVCIKGALGNGEGEFNLQWYWDMPQEAWADSWNYSDRAIEPSLALLRANRRHIAQLLKLPPDVWERYMLIRWPNGQEMRGTVRYVVEMQTRHVDGHINDIRQIRQAHDL